MKTSEIKEKLHDFINNMDERRAIAIYILFENEIEHADLSYSASFKEELDRRVAQYYAGEKMISAEEMNKRLLLFKSKRA